MDVILMIIIMILIGALIGGMTNYLAIKMLFRPYKPVYLGNWRLPFTPGLIPKRRAELAEQLGHVVTDYLVTSDALEEKLLDEDFQQEVIQMINEQLLEFLKRNKTLHEILIELNPSFRVEIIEGQLTSIVAEKIEDVIRQNQEKQLDELIPHSIHNKIEVHLPNFTEYVIDKLEAFLLSDEGKRKVSQSASKFLQTQGFIGNMVSSYLGEDGLSEKITPALTMFLRSSDTKLAIEGILVKEWEQIQKLKLLEIVDFINEDQIDKKIAEKMVKGIDLQSYFSQPLSNLVKDHLDQLTNDWVPVLTSRVLNRLAGQMNELLKRLNLFQLVKNEVETFDVSRIEKLILDITKKEMNMITYLGALLGGLIGLIQGFIVLLLT